MHIAEVSRPFDGYVTRADCQADAACSEAATMIHVAGAGQEPGAWTVLSCTAHERAGRILVNQTTTAITFTYRLEVPAPPTPQLIVMVIDEPDPMGLVVGDGDDAVLWGNGDLILVCPVCGASTDDDDEFAEVDQSHQRWNRLLVEDAWITVIENRDGRDMHTIGVGCFTCDTLLELPEAAEARPVWG